MRTAVENKTMDEERVLYHLTDADVVNCRFAGPADGESALKESADIALRDCSFSLRYPLWHARRFSARNCDFSETCRAAIWYASDGVLEDVQLNGVKAVRECDRLELRRVTADSAEFGWNCRQLKMHHCDITSEYFLMGSSDVTVEDLTLNGKYSFQYNRDLTITNSRLNTKDAFWHAENVTVKDTVIKGEYLGWYSNGLTLINCQIIGTQPLCYCKNLRLIHCTMQDADLAFEYSDVEADIIGEIISVKNPRAGHITADTIGEIILRDAVCPTDCILTERAR